MKKKMSYKIRLGAFILGCLLLLVGLLAYMGGKKNLFSPTIKLHGLFDEVSGLRPGNNVTFSGIVIGVVKTIDIIADTSVKVTVQVDKGNAKFIKKNSKMYIATEGLMGSKMLAISSGTHDAESVKDGDILLTESPFDIQEIMETFKTAGTDISAVAENVLNITNDIVAGKGFVGKVLTDSAFANEMEMAVVQFKTSGENARHFTADLRAISGSIRNGEGSLGMLLQDDSLGRQFQGIVDSLEATAHNAGNAARNISSFTEGMSKDSPVGNLLHDEEMGEDLKQTLSNLRGSSAELGATLQSVQDSWLVNGIFGKKKKKKQKKDTLGTENEGTANNL